MDPLEQIIPIFDDSDKARQVAANPEVNVAFADDNSIVDREVEAIGVQCRHDKRHLEKAEAGE